MSEYLFGLFRGRPAPAAVGKADAIATRRDCCIIQYLDPATGPRGWLAGPNRGAPFDGAMERAVIRDLERSGLWPLPGTETEQW